MNHTEPDAISSNALAHNWEKVQDFARRYETDPSFRHQVDDSPGAMLGGIGFVFPPDVQVRLAVNTDTTMHIVLPPDPNRELADEALQGISAGGDGCASCASTVLSAFLTACGPSTLSTSACASTIGPG